MPPAIAAAPHGPVARAAEFLDRARFLFIPLAMAALLAVGAHAAADSLGDIFLEWIDRAQGAFDAVASRWSLTEGLVDLIGLTRRTQMSRLLALAFELAADVLLAFPMLGFDEKPGLVDRARALLMRASQRPALISVTRALFALALGLAGATSVARLVHGAVALELHPLFGVHGAVALELHPLFGQSGLGLPRLLGLVVVFWLVVAIASRATLRALEHADEKAQRASTVRQRWLLGLTGSAILSPLALAALRAMPFDSFFH